MGRETPSLCVQLYALWITLFPPVAYVPNGWPYVTIKWIKDKNLMNLTSMNQEFMMINM